MAASMTRHSFSLPLQSERLLLGPRHPSTASTSGNSNPTMYRIPRKPLATTARYEKVVAAENKVSYVAGASEPANEPRRQTHLSFMSVWWLEILASILMTAAFIAIVITLSAVDNKTLPRLPFHVSVNTLIAIFAAVLKLSAAFVLAEGLSQSKWSWYMRPRHLHDLQVYDNASRGPLGAFQFIWRLRCRPAIASLGALITIAATLVDPLSQQLIKIYDCQEVVLNDTVSLPRTRLYDPAGEHIGAGMITLPLDFIGSISTGQFSTTQPQVPFSCSTGNCTFDAEYSSVGYCSSCSDVSDRINFTNYQPDNRTVTISVDGYWHNLSFVAGNADAESVRFALTYDGGVSMLWYDSEVEGNRTHDLRAHAMQCSLKPCIHTFRANISNGLLLEETIQRGPEFMDNLDSTSGYRTSSMADLSCVDDSALQDLRDIGYDFDPSTRWMPYNVTFNPDPAAAPGYSAPVILSPTQRGQERGFYNETSSPWTLSNDGLKIVPSPCIYQIYFTTPITLETLYFPAYFNGSVQDTFYGYGRFGPIVPTAFYVAGNMDQYPKGSLELVQDMMQNITDSMTTYMRWHGDELASEPVVGTAYRNTVCIRVRWGYLAFSASITGLLLIFLVAIIIDTRLNERRMAVSAQNTRTFREEPVIAHHNFKSSALANIFHGLDRESLDQLHNVGATNTTSELERISKERLVMLVLTDSGWKLSTDVQR